jgi:hypothetical protein
MNDTLIPKEHWPKERPINFERTIVKESTYSHNSKFGVKKQIMDVYTLRRDLHFPQQDAQR